MPPTRTREQLILDLAVERGLLTPATIEELVAGTTEVDQPASAGGASTTSGATAGLRQTESPTLTIDDADHPQRAIPAIASGRLAARYEVRELLGEGGMGRVFRAFDTVLRREVALKLVRHDGPLPAGRLLQEARAQSRVSHDNVCRVFDAGEVDGQAYIAMPLIHGPTLRQAAASLTMDERLELVAQAADGLHAAHRCGLVHRDLKPGNILLERRAAGVWKAYVVDFGLVRDMDAGASTVQTVGGTPHYMAPEQVRGATDRIDWRADVWALGATLFEVLCGHPPFASTSSMDVLVRVLNEEVQFPVDPRLPRDLQAILEHCLEKEPERRYGSARELAEDLRRVRDGLPVSVRPAGPWIRLVKAARRDRRLTTVALTGTLALVVLAGALARTAWRGRERAELARAFGEEVAAVEAIARYSAFLPPHDARRERAIVRGRIEAIERRTGEIGDLAAGPGAYAVGRGWLVLGDPVRARDALQRGWDAGYRTTAARQALGQALAELYRRGLYEARGIANPEMRQSQERKLAAELRDPALALLRAGGGGASEAPALVEARIALIEERWDDALAAARAASRTVPWLHEAMRLEGEIWLARAQLQTRSGENAAADASLAEAQVALARAIDHARSDPLARTAECRRQSLRIASAARSATSPEPLLAPLRQACGAALAIDPEAVEAHVLLAGGEQASGVWQLEHGQDPSAALGEAVAQAEAALACDPQLAAAHGAIGAAAWRLAQHERKSGRSPRAWSERALASLDAAALIDPYSPRYHADRGLVLSDLGQDQRYAGRDPLPLLVAAMEAYDAALVIDPSLASGYYSRGTAGWKAGEWATLHGLDARPYLQAAILDYKTAGSLNPSLVAVPNALGAAHKSLATYLDAVGGDPAPDWKEAERWYEVAIAQRPDLVNPHYNLCFLLRALAARAIGRGQDPMPLLERARREAAACVAIDARDTRNQLQVGTVELLAAEALIDRNEDPGRSLEIAETAITRAREMDRTDGVVWVAQARLHKLRARHLLRSSGTWNAELVRGLAAIDEAQRRIPSSGQTRQIRAELLLVRAQASTGATRVKAARQALAAADDAESANPNIKGELDALRAQASALLGDAG